MKILLVNEHILGQVSGEETFWSALGKRIPGAETLALKDSQGNFLEYIKTLKPDILIYNSILGDLSVPVGIKKVILLQDNFILMDKVLPKTLRQIINSIFHKNNSFFKKNIQKQKEAIQGADKVVAVSENIAKTYEIKGEVIPIGIDPTLFYPMDKNMVRKKHSIPQNVYVKIFVGSTHKVKGFDLVLKDIISNPNHLYLIVLKDETLPDIKFTNVKIYHKIKQAELAELYNCADVYIGRSRVESLWLAPIEAMFCGIPIDVTPVGIFADWQPKNENPRPEAFDAGLTQDKMISRWQDLLVRL